ncbi:putative ribosomal large subunit pseudouridine synthase B [Candidatus Azobacteroides pseudotrichonymphae genomovar. CFP2]|uniref:Pseudouridine synthase n=1 Tax=Azobacteroides pseudotrichonymphae genomovar. CFP2 TaxID=511995 RepID=B6YRL0_AZOPC|nr:putative ribosomal large subunit pseudouridine synthase B [Candidatus Azobacteroides pseudotrichonymphae genomovar. CFP2]
MLKKNDTRDHLGKEKYGNKWNYNNQGKSDCNLNSKYNFQKKIKYYKVEPNSNGPIRLNRYLANSGLCSRRKADKYIQTGLVKKNGIPVTEFGTRVNRTDNITFCNSLVRSEHKVYLLLNKPKNCVTTTNDPQGRLTVMDLIKTACKEQIFPVGRLDRNTTGVLLLTNDGKLSAKLTHPRHMKKKIYHVWLNRGIDAADIKKLSKGIQLEDGGIWADDISYVNDKDKTQINIEIHSGRNHIIRRMFESLGYHVVKLDRVYFAGLTKKKLKKGQWCFLNDREVSMLYMEKFS